MSTEQPEPTVGQMIDAMHQEIERVCGQRTIIEIKIYGPEKSFVDVRWRDEASGLFLDKSSVADTPQAALRAMIERLREVK